MALRGLAKAVFATTDLFVASPAGPRLLIYHQVGWSAGRQMEVKTADFEWQLQWLMQNREIVDLETALARWDEPNASRLVVLTFDDGFSDLYETAFPMLKSFSIPFTLYLASSIVGADDWDRRGRPLSWNQIALMLESRLLTIGAHTHTHVDLRKVGERAVASEIEKSDEIIEGHLGLTPSHFAYPWGYWSETADEIVRARYASAALGSYSLGSTTSFDPHLVHRFPVQLSDGRRWFAARLRGGLLAEEAVRRRLRKYRGTETITC